MPVINPSNLLSRKELDLCTSTTAKGGGAILTSFFPLSDCFNSMSARFCKKFWDKYKDEKNRCRPRGSLQTDVHDRCETHHDTQVPLAIRV